MRGGGAGCGPGATSSFLCSSTFNWSVPFLSGLALLLFAAAALLFFYVPLRYVVLAWGERACRGPPARTICRTLRVETSR